MHRTPHCRHGKASFCKKQWTTDLTISLFSDFFVMPFYMEISFGFDLYEPKQTRFGITRKGRRTFHGSVLENTSFIFSLVDVDRGFRHVDLMDHLMPCCTQKAAA